MLRLPYQAESLRGPPSPSLSVGTMVHWRPLLPVLVGGPSGLSRAFSRALLDSGADDTIFPLDTAARIQVTLLPDTGHRIRWRGLSHALRFGSAQLELKDNYSTWRWSAIIGFSPAPIAYPILGVNGCLQFMDAHFLGADLVVELQTNRLYTGTVS